MEICWMSGLNQKKHNTLKACDIIPANHVDGAQASILAIFKSIETATLHNAAIKSVPYAALILHLYLNIKSPHSLWALLINYSQGIIYNAQPFSLKRLGESCLHYLQYQMLHNGRYRFASLHLQLR